MSAEEGFLHDICANPTDATPRLVYADWLDERGGKGDVERAEFIRVQCRLHGGEKLTESEELRLKMRDRELFEAWKKVWMKPFKGMFGNYDFKRGFVERATMQTSVFLEHGDKVLSLTPLRIAKLRDPSPHVDELAKCPTLERLWGLSLNYGKMGGERVRRLLTSKRLHHIRWLDLGNNHTYPGGAIHVTKAARRLPNLRYLALDDNELRDIGVEHLAESPLLGQIEALNLDGNALTDDGLRALADSPHACQLAQLHICRHTWITADGVEALLASPRLPALRWVCLEYFSDIAKRLPRLRKKYEHVTLTNAGSMGNLETGPVAKL